MSFIQREIDRLTKKLQEPQPEEIKSQLYAALTALSWALEPGGFKYPHDMIMGIEAETGGYLLPLSQLLFSDNNDHFEKQ